jgi:NitT/TauT family transport system permease protein
MGAANVRRRGLASAVVVGVLVAALQMACQAGLIGHTVLIAPTEMAASLWDILRSGAFTHAILLTLSNVALSAAIAITGGFVAGVAIHASGFLRRGLEPYLASYYAVPTFIFYPVFIVLLGVGSAPIIAIAVLLAIVAMITATLNGLDRVPRVFDKTGRILHLSPLQLAVLVQLPAALPYLFTGARLAVAYSFIGVIASEFVLSADGIGYAIAYAYNNFDNRTMYGLMLLIIVVVIAVNTTLDVLDRRLQSRLRREG